MIFTTNSLALLTGVTALCIATYLQFLGKGAPFSFAVGFYTLGAGIIFILAEMNLNIQHSFIVVGLLLILLSECITAWSIVASYDLDWPWEAIGDWRGGNA